MSIYRNSTGIGSFVPSFAAKQDFNVGMLPVSVAAADLNGDGLRQR